MAINYNTLQNIYFNKHDSQYGEYKKNQLISIV